MRVVVTGREGQLARSLVERAAGIAGVELAAVGRPELDLEVAGSAARAIAAADPEVVINAAAYTAVDRAEEEPDRAFRINADAAGEVAEAARSAGAAVIQISTDYVFDGRSPEPYGEHSPVSPTGVYGRSKLAGEERVRAANPDHLILRTAWVYSPFGRNFVRTMLGLARNRDEVAVVDDQRGTPTSALDLADGLLAVLRADRQRWGETFHFAGQGTCSWADLAEETFRASRELGGPTAKVRRITTAEFAAPAPRPAFSALDSTRFEQAFGFTARDWRASLRAVVERLLSEEAAGRA